MFLNNAKCPSLLSETYNNVLRSLVGEHVPLKTVRTVRKRVPWFSNELKEAIQARRRSEKLWRKTENPAHRSEFVRRRNFVKNLTTSLRQKFYSEFVDNHSNSPREL